MHRGGRERGHAHRHVLGALLAGRAVADVLAGAGQHRLARADLEDPGLVLDPEGAAEDQRVLIELGALARLDPAPGCLLLLSLLKRD